MAELFCWGCYKRRTHIEIAPIVYRCTTCRVVRDLTDPDETALVSQGADCD